MVRVRITKGERRSKDSNNKKAFEEETKVQQQQQQQQQQVRTTATPSVNRQVTITTTKGPAAAAAAVAVIDPTFFDAIKDKFDFPDDQDIFENIEICRQPTTTTTSSTTIMVARDMVEDPPLSSASQPVQQQHPQVQQRQRKKEVATIHEENAVELLAAATPEEKDYDAVVKVDDDDDDSTDDSEGEDLPPTPTVSPPPTSPTKNTTDPKKQRRHDGIFGLSFATMRFHNSFQLEGTNNNNIPIPPVDGGEETASLCTASVTTHDTRSTKNEDPVRALWMHQNSKKMRTISISNASADVFEVMQGDISIAQQQLTMTSPTEALSAGRRGMVVVASPANAGTPNRSGSTTIAASSPSIGKVKSHDVDDAIALAATKRAASSDDSETNVAFENEAIEILRSSTLATSTDSSSVTPPEFEQKYHHDEKDIKEVPTVGVTSTVDSIPNVKIDTNDDTIEVFRSIRDMDYAVAPVQQDEDDDEDILLATAYPLTKNVPMNIQTIESTDQNIELLRSSTVKSLFNVEEDDDDNNSTHSSAATVPVNHHVNKKVTFKDEDNAIEILRSSSDKSSTQPPAYDEERLEMSASVDSDETAVSGCNVSWQTLPVQIDTDNEYVIEITRSGTNPSSTNVESVVEHNINETTEDDLELANMERKGSYTQSVHSITSSRRKPTLKLIKAVQADTSPSFESLEKQEMGNAQPITSEKVESFSQGERDCTPLSTNNNTVLPKENPANVFFQQEAPVPTSKEVLSTPTKSTEDSIKQTASFVPTSGGTREYRRHKQANKRSCNREEGICS